MRILFLHRWVGLHEGGTETNVKNSILFLADKGHQVSLITVRGDALPQAIISNSNIVIYYLPLGWGESKFSYASMYDPRLYFYTGWYALRLLLKIVWLHSVKKFRPQVMSVHFSTEFLAAWVVRALFNIPISFSLEGYTTMEASLAKFSNIQFACSRDVVEKCQKNFGYRPIVRWHGASTKRFSSQGSNFKNQFFSVDDFVVLSVCRLEPRKNISTLIKAAAITAKQESNIKYLLVGEGVESDLLHDLAAQLSLGDYVKFAGRVAEADLPAYYRSGDIYVLPTLYEGFGIVYIEAMASGLPIISTTAGAVPEVVRDAGILLDPMDVSGFAREIINLYKSPSLRNRFRERGFYLVSNDYNLEKWMSIFEEGLLRMAKN